MVYARTAPPARRRHSATRGVSATMPGLAGGMHPVTPSRRSRRSMLRSKLRRRLQAARTVILVLGPAVAAVLVTVVVFALM